MRLSGQHDGRGMRVRNGNCSSTDNFNRRGAMCRDRVPTKPSRRSTAVACRRHQSSRAGAPRSTKSNMGLLTPDERFAFDVNGYVKLENALSARELAAVNNRLNGLEDLARSYADEHPEIADGEMPAG